MNEKQPVEDITETKKTLQIKLRRLVKIFVEDDEFVGLFGKRPSKKVLTALLKFVLCQDVSYSLQDLRLFIWNQRK